ncbi:hypothetical protein ES703_123080 [subsurface metagenome]
MARLKSEQTEKDAARMAAALMAASARTAPKGAGIDDTETLIVDGNDLEELAVAMEHKAETQTPLWASVFKTCANNVRNSSCVLLIGVMGHSKQIPIKPREPLDCGACGFISCEKFDKARKQAKDFSGAICAFQAMDLGIALGSAVKMASQLNIDNRIMYVVGAGAKELRLLDSDLVIGIPLSITRKNPYFDRR